MDFLRKIFERKETPRYREIELEAKLDKVKDDLIESLQEQIKYLEIELQKKQENMRLQPKEEIPAEEPMPTRIKVSTMTQLAGIMEAASIARKRNKEKSNEKDS